MHIKKIEVKNWIGLTELAIDPGKINFITGRKGSGKTSLIESLDKAFTNKNRRAEVVRHGEEEATIFIQTDTGLEVERRVRDNEKSNYLKIRKPGESVPQTEAFLRRLINGEIFRPLEFIKKKPEDQAKIILNMLEIPWTMENIRDWFGEIPGVNFEAHILQVLKQIEQLYYTQREVINREVNVLKAQVKGIRDELPPNYDGDHWREQKVAEYYGKVAEAEEVNKKIAVAQNLIENLESIISAIKYNAESDKQSKKNHFERQRADIREFKQFLAHKIEANQDKVKQVDDHIRQADETIDLELKQKIQALREEYSLKKEQSKRNIQTEADALILQNSEYQNSIAAKEQELVNIDQLEEQSLVSIDEKVLEKIETENARVGNAKTILEQHKEIDVEPLRKEANEVADMQSYLRDYDRMSYIINTKIAPKEEQSKVLTARINKARELPMELLKIAAVPIPGITVDGDGMIRIGQTLLSGLSEGEQLELAFRVAKAQAGELKVICIDGINKINEADRKWLEQEMETDDLQYFCLNTCDGDLNIEIKEETA